MASGPLSGIRIVELAGIGPGPFAAMVLSDMGAEVVRVDRSSAVRGPGGPNVFDVTSRGRRSIAVDLKSPEGVETVLALVEKADVLLEGFRPGVTERLGVGPDECLARNPKLVYGRMTGWGQDGPLATVAGHDVNYISLAGSLGHIGRAGEAPVPPLNIIGDYGGGGMFLAYGVVCALLEASRSGQGQVVDAAMVDGTAALMAMFHGFYAAGINSAERGTNMLDTGAHFYEVYECADGGHLSTGAIEPQFYAQFVNGLGLADDADLKGQMDRDRWPALKEKIAARVKEKTRDEWAAIFDGTDACTTPVLTFDEARAHPHMAARGTFVEVEGVAQHAPAPRFSRTPGGIQGPAPSAGQHTDEVLADWLGLDADAIAAKRDAGAVA